MKASLESDDRLKEYAALIVNGQMIAAMAISAAQMISKAPSRCFAPHFRASLIAPSLASAPLLQKKTWSRPEHSARRLARRAISAL